jgi:hypothetical protein
MHLNGKINVFNILATCDGASATGRHFLELRSQQLITIQENQNTSRECVAGSALAGAKWYQNAR